MVHEPDIYLLNKQIFIAYQILHEVFLWDMTLSFSGRGTDSQTLGDSRKWIQLGEPWTVSVRLGVLDFFIYKIKTKHLFYKVFMRSKWENLKKKPLAFQSPLASTNSNARVCGLGCKGFLCMLYWQSEGIQGGINSIFHRNGTGIT